MNTYRIGDIVKHNYFEENQGTVTDLRIDSEYCVFVTWDITPERNDWYKPEFLVPYRVSTAPNPIAPPVGADGAIGISNSSEGAHITPAIERDTSFPFGN